MEAYGTLKDMQARGIDITALFGKTGEDVDPSEADGNDGVCVCLCVAHLCVFVCCVCLCVRCTLPLLPHNVFVANLSILFFPL